jgi:C1A family cysteine protease
MPNLIQIHAIIKKELYLYGPTTMAFPVTEEFLHYESGIFHPVPEADFEKRIIYWHVVRLIGWNHDSRDKIYWIAINSFGEQWGDNG